MDLGKRHGIRVGHPTTLRPFLIINSTHSPENDPSNRLAYSSRKCHRGTVGAGPRGNAIALVDGFPMVV